MKHFLNSISNCSVAFYEKKITLLLGLSLGINYLLDMCIYTHSSPKLHYSD